MPGAIKKRIIEYLLKPLDADPADGQSLVFNAAADEFQPGAGGGVSPRSVHFDAGNASGLSSSSRDAVWTFFAPGSDAEWEEFITIPSANVLRIEQAGLYLFSLQLGAQGADGGTTGFLANLAVGGSSSGQRSQSLPRGNTDTKIAAISTMRELVPNDEIFVWMDREGTGTWDYIGGWLSVVKLS